RADRPHHRLEVIEHRSLPAYLRAGGHDEVIGDQLLRAVALDATDSPRRDETLDDVVDVAVAETLCERDARDGSFAKYQRPHQLVGAVRRADAGQSLELVLRRAAKGRRGAAPDAQNQTAVREIPQYGADALGVIAVKTAQDLRPRHQL